MGRSRPRDRRLHLRADASLFSRIEELAAVQRKSRAQVVLELLELALQLQSDLEASAIGQALRRIDVKLDDGQRLLGELVGLIDRQARDSQDNLHRSLDRLTRLGVESVMILRRLAQLKAPNLLHDAQQAAREFVRDRSASALHPNERSIEGGGTTG